MCVVGRRVISGFLGLLSCVCYYRGEEGGGLNIVEGALL